MKTEISLQPNQSSIPFFTHRPGKECTSQTREIDQLLSEIRNGSKVRSEMNRAFGEDTLLTFATPELTSSEAYA